MGTSPNTATFASVFMAILRSRCGQHHCRLSSLGDGEAPTRAMELSPRGQAVKILGASVEPHPAAVLDDLEAIVVEFRLMQPSVAFRDRFGGHENAGTDEFRGHAAALRRLGIRRQDGYVEIGVEGDLRTRDSRYAIGATRRCRSTSARTQVHDSLKSAGGRSRYGGRPPAFQDVGDTSGRGWLPPEAFQVRRSAPRWPA
jgi:hypothetical protein